MAGYEKQTWTDKITDVTAERMNHIEKGIEDAGKTGGVETGSVIGWTGGEVPEGYEEVDSSLLPSNSGIEVGTIVDWEDGVEIPEGWEETEGKSIVQVGYNGSTAFTITTTNTKTFVPMAKQLSKIGNGFTVQSDGTVLVNKTMKIRAKAQVMLTASGTGAKILMIDINQYDWSYDRVVSLKDYVPLKSDTYILDVKQGDILRLYYQGDANDTFHTSTAFVYMYIEEINDPNKPIKKVAVTEVPKIEGSIVDGTNIDNKTTNTYSANTIDGLFKAKTIWSGNTTGNITFDKSLEYGHIYMVEMYEFSSTYKTYRPFVYLERGQWVQVALTGLDASNNIILERYRFEVYDTGMNVIKNGSYTNCNITGIYKIS